MKYINICKALYDYEKQNDEEITFKEDDILYIIETDDPDWWKAQLKIPSLDQAGPVGLVPSNYVEEAEPIGTVKAMYDYDAQQEEELTVKEDEILVLYENDDPDWYLVKSRNGDIGLTPSNYVETISEEHTTSHEATNNSGSSTINTANNIISATKQNVDDEALSWSVHEYDTEKKKKKKSKGNLLIGNGLLCYGSETDKSIPVQQFSILDVKSYNLDGKNIHISLNSTVFDFQSSSKSEAKAIINKLDESLSLANNHQTSSLPSTTVHENHNNETTPLPTSTPSINAQPEYDHHIPEPEPESVSAPEPEQPICEPRWSIILYDFDGQEEGELTVKEQDQVLAIDYVSSEDWWTIELQDGRSGIVPATYVKFQEDYEADLAIEADAEAAAAAETLKQQELEKKQRQMEMERAEKQRQLEFEAAEKEKQRQLEEAERQRQLDQQQQQLEKERGRQLEAERRRKMQEEAKQREMDAKRAATRAASATTNSPQITSAAVASSPRRSQIPAPPPPTIRSSPSPRHVTPADHHQQQHPANDRSKPSHDAGKPDSAKVRTWTDRTGAFKVDAQLLACNNGKIRLHKVNGVKIDVPVHKMCVEDLRYIEQETGAKLIEDKNDNIPLAHLTSSPSSSNNNNNNKTDGINWFDFFTKLNIPSKDGLHYAAAFQQERLGEKDLEYLTHKRMKNLGMTERHIRRLQKYVESQEIDLPSDGEAVHRENNAPIFGNKKAKKTVTFGSTSIIHDEDEDGNLDETTRKQKQIEEDERLARQLQQQENEGRSGSTTLHRRGTARPVPTNSAPKDMNFQVMDKIKSQLSTEPLQPSNTGTVNTAPSSQFLNSTTTIATSSSSTAVSSSPLLSSASTNQASGFKDDAWANRTIENKSPNLQAQQPLQSSSPQPLAAADITTTTSNSLSPEQKIQQQIEQIQQYQQQQKQKQQLDQQRAEQEQIQQQLEQQKQQLILQQQQLQQQQQQIQLQQQQQQQQQPQLQQPHLQQPAPLPPRQRPTPQVSQVNRIDPQLLNQWTSNNQSSPQLQQQPSPLMQNMMHTGTIQPNLPPRSPNQFAQQLPQQNQFGTPVFSQNQSSPMLQVNLQPQMTGYPSHVPLQPTSAPLKPQATGRNWSTATPDNPFGSGAQVVSQSPSPNMTQYSGNLQSSSLQPAQVFAQMTGSPAANMQQPALTGFNPQQQQPSNPNDPYSVFKSMNPQVPSVFNPQQQQQMAQFQQPQQTGFMQQQQQPFQGGRW